ncbi:MAG: ATP-binding protein [Planctomycetaceae bacterium]|nr:ATP-binding protein [Planctomycetaceae bacterium]
MFDSWNASESGRPDLSGRMDGPFLGESQFEAACRIEYAWERRVPLLIARGHSGIGKSSLLKLMQHRFQRRGIPVARVSLAGLERGELPTALAEKLRLTQPTADNSPQWRPLIQGLDLLAATQAPPCLLLDDVNDCCDEAVPDLLRLVGVIEETQRGLLVVALRTPVGNASDPLANRLSSRCDVFVELCPWSREDCGNYLRELGLGIDGQNWSFAPNAVETIARLTGGDPSQVVRLARLSCLAAVAEGRNLIGREVILACARELGDAVALVDETAKAGSTAV